MHIRLVLFAVMTAVLISSPGFAEEQRTQPPENRIASFYVSEDFINEQIARHSKSELIKDMKVSLDADDGQIFLRGLIQVPVEELRAVNLDPKLGAFRFQAAIKLSTTRHGHLILDFPLNETYFYPAVSKDPKEDRIIIPVQLISLALASARGYLAALSGDFSGFDRRTKKITALMKALDRSLAEEKNNDAREEMKNQREALRLQLAAVPVERKQLEGLSKEYEHIMGFTGERELNINNELAAKKNALILKIKLSELVPYLNGIELGGVRILHDKKDGTGQNYLAIDVASTSTVPHQPKSGSGVARAPMKVPPSLMIRLNQALLESDSITHVEKEAASSKLRDLDIQLKDDGLHVFGKWHAFLFNVPFDVIADFVSTQPDVFEVRLRDIKVAGMDFEFMSKFILESIKKRLDHALGRICTFDYVGEENDHSRALRVKVNPSELVPAFPDLHLVGVDVRDQEFLLKIGKL